MVSEPCTARSSTCSRRCGRLTPDDLVRGQFAGYRDEPGVAHDSDVETFCALRLFIDSWRWAGVPWYLRSGKCLPTTATEILVSSNRRRSSCSPTPRPLAAAANYLRFRIAPDAAIALAARVKRAGEEFVGDQHELLLLDAQPDERDALRTPARRRHGRRRSALHPRGRGRGRLGGRRADPRQPSPCAPLLAGQLGSRAGR